MTMMKMNRHLIMMVLESHKFWKPWDEEAMHVILWSNHKLTESPECILIRVEIHEEKGDYLRHALTVANLNYSQVVTNVFHD